MSRDAVYKRIRRETLRSEHGEDGRLYVYIDVYGPSAESSTDAAVEGSTDRLIASQEGQIEFLRAELERRGEEADRYQRIVAGLSQANADLSARVRELEASEATQSAQEPQDVAESASEDESPAEAFTEPQTETSQASERRPWWRRILGR